MSEKTRAMSEHDAPPVYPEDLVPVKRTKFVAEFVYPPGPARHFDVCAVTADLAPLGRKKIVTVFVYPPIPIRSMDWCAHYDGEEERGEYGEGATKEAAVADLLANWPEDGEP